MIQSGVVLAMDNKGELDWLVVNTDDWDNDQVVPWDEQHQWQAITPNTHNLKVLKQVFEELLQEYGEGL